MDKHFPTFGSLPSDITFRHLAPDNLKKAASAIGQSPMLCMSAADERRPSGELSFRGGLSLSGQRVEPELRKKF
jgi:hypothetical protein